jgi:hypothetical protein
MLERRHRVVPAELTRKAAALLGAPATTLPLRDSGIAPATARLGSERVRRVDYPWFRSEAWRSSQEWLCSKR